MKFCSTVFAERLGARFFGINRYGALATRDYEAAKSWATNPAPGTWRGIWRVKGME